MAFNKVSGPAAATLFQRDAQSRGQVQRSFTRTFFEKMGWRAEYSAFLRRTQKRFSFFSREALGNLTNKFQRLLRLVNFYKIPLNLATSLPTTKKSETSEKSNQKNLE